MSPHAPQEHTLGTSSVPGGDSHGSRGPPPSQRPRRERRVHASTFAAPRSHQGRRNATARVPPAHQRGARRGPSPPRSQRRKSTKSSAPVPLLGPPAPLRAGARSPSATAWSPPSWWRWHAGGEASTDSVVVERVLVLVLVHRIVNVLVRLHLRTTWRNQGLGLGFAARRHTAALAAVAAVHTGARAQGWPGPSELRALRKSAEPRLTCAPMGTPCGLRASAMICWISSAVCAQYAGRGRAQQR